MSFAKASASGSASCVSASSCASGIFPRAWKPLYQRSCGSSGRPRRSSISAATWRRAASSSTVVSSSFTRCSGISRCSSKLRRIAVGAVGEYGSAAFAARNWASSFA